MMRTCASVLFSIFFISSVVCLLTIDVQARPSNNSPYLFVPIHPGWPQTIIGQEDVWLGLVAPVSQDFDGDGRQEVFVALPGIPSSQLFLFREDGSVVWQRNVSCVIEPSSTPSVGDVASFAGEEIIFPCRNWTSAVLIIGNAGDVVVQGVPLKLSDTSFGAIVLNDIDRDSRLDLVYGGDNASGSYLVAMRADGSLLLGFPLFVEGPYSEVNTPAIGDLLQETIVVVSRPNNAEPGSRIRAVSTNGRILWTIDYAGYLFGDPVIADVTGDGLNDVVVASEQSVLVLNGTGDVVREITLGDFAISTPLAIADLDAAPGKEIIVGRNTQLFIIANLSVQRTLELQSSITSVPVIGETDNTGREDIFVVAGNAVYAVTSEGMLLRGFPLPLPFFSTSVPSIADLDGNGALELLLSSTRNGEEPSARIFVWDLRGEQASWPHYQQNIRRAGSIDDAGGSSLPKQKMCTAHVTAVD
ncbi:MAG: VCBS repeat-containing protein [archaeon]